MRKIKQPSTSHFHGRAEKNLKENQQLEAICLRVRSRLMTTSERRHDSGLAALSALHLRHDQHEQTLKVACLHAHKTICPTSSHADSEASMLRGKEGEIATLVRKREERERERRATLVAHATRKHRKTPIDAVCVDRWPAPSPLKSDHHGRCRPRSTPQTDHKSQPSSYPERGQRPASPPIKRSQQHRPTRAWRRPLPAQRSHTKHHNRSKDRGTRSLENTTHRKTPTAMQSVRNPQSSGVETSLQAL